jgi:hypothetical protein
MTLLYRLYQTWEKIFIFQLDIKIIQVQYFQCILSFFGVQKTSTKLKCQQMI